MDYKNTKRKIEKNIIDLEKINNALIKKSKETRTYSQHVRYMGQTRTLYESEWIADSTRFNLGFPEGDHPREPDWNTEDAWNFSSGGWSSADPTIIIKNQYLPYVYGTVLLNNYDTAMTRWGSFFRFIRIGKDSESYFLNFGYAGEYPVSNPTSSPLKVKFIILIKPGFDGNAQYVKK